MIRDVPVFVLTKNADFICDDSFMLWMESLSPNCRPYLHFGFTLTGRDDLEPKASPNADRLVAMAVMSDMGFSTFASIEPVIDWVSSERIVSEALAFCDHFKLGLRSGVKKDYYDPDESFSAIKRIVWSCKACDRTIYLKESTRQLLKRFLWVNSYSELLSDTVDMNGNKYNQNEVWKQHQETRLWS